MGEPIDADDDSTIVGKGDEHLSARIDEESYRRIRVTAAENDMSVAELVRISVSDTLTELEEGNRRATTAVSRC